MPVAAPRPCRHLGCSKLVRDGSGYCESHQPDRQRGKFSDRQRGSRHERGYGADWVRRRIVILRRDGGLCQPCLRAGRVTTATQVDHITPKSDGGTDAEDNLQSICADCHAAKTAAEAGGARRRPSSRREG
ncbi:MAG: HNH endonuclease [Rhodocyclaceae bacterium]|nr:HNH endonuclease [Rhodocyclaceae bacterium]